MLFFVLWGDYFIRQIKGPSTTKSTKSFQYISMSAKLRKLPSSESLSTNSFLVVCQEQEQAGLLSIYTGLSTVARCSTLLVRSGLKTKSVSLIRLLYNSQNMFSL